MTRPCNAHWRVQFGVYLAGRLRCLVSRQMERAEPERIAADLRKTNTVESCATDTVLQWESGTTCFPYFGRKSYMWLHVLKCRGLLQFLTDHLPSMRVQAMQNCRKTRPDVPTAVFCWISYIGSIMCTDLQMWSVPYKSVALPSCETTCHDSPSC